MRPFALYRYPFEKNYTLISGSEMAFSTLQSLDVREGFLLSKFNGREGILIESESKSIGAIDDLPEYDHITYIAADSYKTEFDSYNRVFDKFYSAIARGEFEKLVLSRCHRIKILGSVSDGYLKGLFKYASQKYRSAFVYVAGSERFGVWFGCSPEVLIEGKDGKYSSAAIAGTMPVERKQWSGKNIREQACVAGFVRATLQELCCNVSQSNPYSIEAGGIKHIKTDFKFSLPNNRSVLDIASKLHPTPAVCGLERDAALRFIEDNEDYDRSCYAGITGVSGSETHLYVNLRCVNFKGSDAALYAGGGLVKGSNALDEWNETESKLQTIMSIL